MFMWLASCGMSLHPSRNRIIAKSVIERSMIWTHEVPAPAWQTSLAKGQGEVAETSGAPGSPEPDAPCGLIAADQAL